MEVIEKKETIDVIGLDGKQQSANATPLADIFNKIEAGKEEGKSAKEVIKETAEEKAKPVQREEKKEEVKIEKKDKSDLEKKLDDTQAKKDEDKEVKDEQDARAALRKATELPKKEEKKVEEEVKGDVIPEEELRVLDTDKPKTAKRIQALLKKIETTNAEVTKTRAEAKEKADKLAEYEKKLNETKPVDPKTDEAVKKQLDELSMYRRRYELDNDPELKTKFDNRVESAEQSIVDTLKKRGAGEALLKIVKEEGGWTGFSSSGRLLTLPDADGGTKQVPASEVADAILQGFPLGERKAVEAAMMEQVQTKRDRERFFKEEQAKASDYFKKRDEETQKQSAVQQTQVEEAKKTIDNWRKAVEASEWLKDKELPENATPAQKAEAEDYNKYNSQLKGLISQAVAVKDLNGMLDLVHDSVRYYDERRTSHMLRKENERLKTELEKKNEEFTKFKTAGRSVPKHGSISTAATDQARTEKKPRSLEDAFSILESGGNLKDE